MVMKSHLLLPSYNNDTNILSSVKYQHYLNTYKAS